MSIFDQICLTAPSCHTTLHAKASGWPQTDESTHWYVVRANARHEKSVARMLGLLGYPTFLPLTKKTHEYGRRLREYDIPLFPGYLFCHFVAGIARAVAQLPSILEVVGVGGVPSVIPDAEICSLRLAVDAQLPMRPWPYLEIGDSVRITEGPMAGVNGVVLDRTTRSMRVVLSINLLRRSVLLEVSRVDVERFR
jgi:transcription antitermination factor NusG